MVEELKLAIKIDDESVEQSLLKQFANAQKMADKVVLDFKNVNFDDKNIEAKFKEMQKKAGQNPINLTISGNTLNMLGQIDKKLTEIFSIGKGKSFIDSSSTVADIGKIENKINELNKKYEETQKKLSSIGSGNVSGKNVNLVDNAEFQKLTQEVSELKNQFDDLKTHMQLLDDYTVPTDRFFELQSQVEGTTARVSDLVNEFTKLSNAQKALSSTPQVETNISSGSTTSAVDNQIKKQNEYNDLVAVGYDRIQKMKKISESGTTGSNSVYDLLRLNHEAWDEVKANNFFNKIPEKGLKRYTKILEVVEKIVQEMVQASGLTEEQIVAQLKNIKAAQGGSFKLNGADSGWTHFATYSNGQKDSMQKVNGITYKVYAAFDDIKDLNQNVVSSIMDELTKAGFKGRLKTTSGSTSFGDKLNGLAITDQMVVHGSTKKDQEIAYNTLKNMGLKLSYLGGGIDTPDGSFSQTLASGEINKYIQGLEKEATAAKDTAKAEQQLAEARKESSSTTSQGQLKDAFQGNDATASVEKTTQAIREENSALEETTNKAKQAVSELVKGRDVVSQNWYREKGTVIGKDSKGNDITRDADEFSFVERLQNGQLQTVLATYNEETGKWLEQVINVRTAFEQVEKAIISADNKIASLEMAKEKTLAAHPGYDTTADDNQIAIERKKRDELQATLNLYGQEKEYVFEIEAANKRIADNQERLNNKKQSQTNLRQVVSDEQFLKDWDAAIAENNKRDAEAAKQASKELNNAWNEAVKVNTALDKTKTTLSSLSKMPELTSNFSDMESKISNLNSDLTSGKITLSEYKNEVKSLTSEYSKMVSIQQNRNVEEYTANAEAAKKEATELQAVAEAKKKARQTEKESTQASVDNALKDQLTAWKNIQSIREKINNTSDTHEIEVLKQVKSEYQQNYIAADKILKANSDLYDKETQLAKLEQIRIEANNKIASSQEKQMSSYENKLASYQSKTSGYEATIKRFEDGGWTSDAYLKNVQAIKDAVAQYETLLNKIKTEQGGIASEDDIQNLKEYESEIKKTISTVTNMSASEKGYNFTSAQKELDKIHKLLNENSRMSSDAKAKIRAYYAEIESGNPSMTLERIHGEIMKIYNAEVEAGRAGRSFLDTLKNSGFHQLAAQMAGMFSFYDVVNAVKQAASTVVDLNTQITELSKVSEATSSQIYDDFSSYADIAEKVGGTISDTISATADWSRNGYNLSESKELAEVALLYKNVGDGIDIDTANESLISTLRGFKLEAEDALDIINVFNEVSNNEPIDSAGIGEAMQRSAASFYAANTTLQESVALISATNSVVQDPEKVGNMWKTVSMRIRSATSEIEEAGEDTDGMVESTADLQKMIKAMTGYDILEEDGKTFKSIYDIVLNISKVWSSLSDVDQSALLQALAGKQQSNALAAALSSPDILEKSYQEAMNSEGSALEEQKKYQESIQYSIDQTKAKLEELANDFLSSDFLKGLIDAGGKIIDILDAIIKHIGILTPLLAGTAIKKIITNFD